MEKARIVLAWVFCLLVIVAFGLMTFFFAGFDPSKLQKYLPPKVLNSVANLIFLYGSLILFDFAFPGKTLHAIMVCDSENSTIEDKKVAAYLVCALAVSTAYVIANN